MDGEADGATSASAREGAECHNCPRGISGSLGRTRSGELVFGEDLGVARTDQSAEGQKAGRGHDEACFLMFHCGSGPVVVWNRKEVSYRAPVQHDYLLQPS